MRLLVIETEDDVSNNSESHAMLRASITCQCPGEDLPGHIEVFAFPQGARTKTGEELKTHTTFLRSFTMTDEDGVHIFGHCFVSYVPCEQNGTDNVSLFRPCCLCIVTDLPFHCSFRRFLACYVDARATLGVNGSQTCQLQLSVGATHVVCESFAEEDLTLIRGLLHKLETDLNATWGQPVHIELGPHLVSFQPPSFRPDQSLPVADADFDAIFSVLPAQAFLQAFNALLCEQQVLLLSKDALLLSEAAECLLLLLYPLEWSHLMIPVLPNKMVDVLQAPVPYVIGAHVDTITNLPPVRTAAGLLAPFVPETVIQVNLDNGTVAVPEKEVDWKEMGRELQGALGDLGKGLKLWTQRTILGGGSPSNEGSSSPNVHRRSSFNAGQGLTDPDTKWVQLPPKGRADLLDAINTYAIRPLYSAKLFSSSGVRKAITSWAGAPQAPGDIEFVPAAEDRQKVGNRSSTSSTANVSDTVKAIHTPISGRAIDSSSCSSGAQKAFEVSAKRVQTQHRPVGTEAGGCVNVSMLRQAFHDVLLSWLYRFGEYIITSRAPKSGNNNSPANEITQGFDDKYDRQKFVNSCSKHNIPFLQNLVSTQMFVCMVDNRLLKSAFERPPADLFDKCCAAMLHRDEQERAKFTKEQAMRRQSAASSSAGGTAAAEQYRQRLQQRKRQLVQFYSRHDASKANEATVHTFLTQYTFSELCTSLQNKYGDLPEGWGDEKPESTSVPNTSKKTTERNSAQYQSPVQKMMIPPGWEQRWDPASGHPYYFNASTGQSVWSLS